MHIGSIFIAFRRDIALFVLMCRETHITHSLKIQYRCLRLSIVFIREAVQLQLYLIQIDPRSCPRQSILAIMTEIFAYNHIFSQPRSC